MRITLNGDKEYVHKIREALKANDFYCPCRIEKNEDNKCICKETNDMIEQGITGTCHCGLYIITEE